MKDPVNLIFFCFIVCACIFLGTLTVSALSTNKNITITSHVDNIDYLEDYMVVRFSNGDEYNVGYSGENVLIDFDQSEEVTVRLNYVNVFWFTNSNDCWHLLSIVKY